jgi:hypothetical protein
MPFLRLKKASTAFISAQLRKQLSVIIEVWDQQERMPAVINFPLDIFTYFSAWGTFNESAGEKCSAQQRPNYLVCIFFLPPLDKSSYQYSVNRHAFTNA